MKKKKTIKVLIIIIIIGIVINLGWLGIVKLKYDGYKEPLKFSDKMKVYYNVDDDEYTYSLRMPNYMSFTGNLSVSKIDDDSIIIWPKIDGSMKIGVILIEDKSAYEVYIDNDLNVVGDYDKEVIDVVLKHKDNIKKLYDKANEMWDLN